MFVVLTPFLSNPSGDILITNQRDEIVSSTSFIEAVTSTFDMTLHLRSPEPGEYTVKLILFYCGEISEEDGQATESIRPEKKIVDRVEKRFIMDNRRMKNEE